MSAVAAAPRSRNRIVSVVRLHLANPWTTITFPWIVMLTIIALTILVWLLVLANIPDPNDRAQAREGFGYSGSASFIFVYMIVVAVQSINTMFPFAQGFGVTRRNFSLGTAVYFVLLSALFSSGLMILSVIEDATNGWGVGGSIFSVGYFGETAPERLFVFFAIMILFFFSGSAIAAIYLRWRATGITIFFIALGFAILGAGALVTAIGAWGAIGDWFAATGLVGSFAWSFVVSALAALGGYGVLRRITPKN
jgi:hypothetical protein